MEVDTVADMGVDMVADINMDTDIDVDINININMEIQFGERVGHGSCLIGPKLFLTRSLLTRLASLFIALLEGTKKYFNAEKRAVFLIYQSFMIIFKVSLTKCDFF